MYSSSNDLTLLHLQERIQSSVGFLLDVDATPEAGAQREGDAGAGRHAKEVHRLRPQVRLPAADARGLQGAAVVLLGVEAEVRRKRYQCVIMSCSNLNLFSYFHNHYDLSQPIRTLKSF